ncbi:UNKNOWN [Stylonychia lemnae]|uniref:Uncharacterized protein n=1 Tax=Stylonychia lemnae TaxID=5949 RepID=A0A078B382_STYLE|nr:UNKNOWN [Stylonychia lemnae]|eukprot:CDW88889.1 UNKNOWN [Stylonychia lemnae]
MTERMKSQILLLGLNSTLRLNLQAQINILQAKSDVQANKKDHIFDLAEMYMEIFNCFITLVSRSLTQKLLNAVLCVILKSLGSFINKISLSNEVPIRTMSLKDQISNIRDYIPVDLQQQTQMKITELVGEIASYSRDFNNDVKFMIQKKMDQYFTKCDNNLRNILLSKLNGSQSGVSLDSNSLQNSAKSTPIGGKIMMSDQKVKDMFHIGPKKRNQTQRSQRLRQQAIENELTTTTPSENLNDDRDYSPNDVNMTMIKSDNEALSTPEPLPVNQFNEEQEQDPESQQKMKRQKNDDSRETFKQKSNNDLFGNLGEVNEKVAKNQDKNVPMVDHEENSEFSFNGQMNQTSSKSNKDLGKKSDEEGVIIKVDIEKEEKLRQFMNLDGGNDSIQFREDCSSFQYSNFMTQQVSQMENRVLYQKMVQNHQRGNRRHHRLQLASSQTTSTFNPNRNSNYNSRTNSIRGTPISTPKQTPTKRRNNMDNYYQPSNNSELQSYQPSTNLGRLTSPHQARRQNNQTRNTEMIQQQRPIQQSPNSRAQSNSFMMPSAPPQRRVQPIQNVQEEKKYTSVEDLF